MDFTSRMCPELPNVLIAKNLVPERCGSGLSHKLLSYSGLTYMADAFRENVPRP